MIRTNQVNQSTYQWSDNSSNRGEGFATDGFFSIIDQFSTFDGSFIAERDLRVDGTVKGTIDCKGTLFVANGATVSARVEAENITVAGELTGDINCRGKLQLLPSGRLNGKVSTSALVISKGAMYDGDLVMVAATPTPVQPELQSEELQSDRPAPAERTTPARRPAVTPANAQLNTDRTSETPAEPATPSTFIRRLGGHETPWEEAATGDRVADAPDEESKRATTDT
ncbi:polymer-forming cytoskeletal protein [soil metagenome]